MGIGIIKGFYKNLSDIMKNNGGREYVKYNVKGDYNGVTVKDREEYEKLKKLGEGLFTALSKSNVPKVSEKKSGNKARYFFEIAEGDGYYLVDVLTSHLKKTGLRIDEIQIHYDLQWNEIEYLYGQRTSTAIDTIRFNKTDAYINPKSALMKKNKYYKTGKLK